MTVHNLDGLNLFVVFGMSCRRCGIHQPVQSEPDVFSVEGFSVMEFDPLLQGEGILLPILRSFDLRGKRRNNLSIPVDLYKAFQHIAVNNSRDGRRGGRRRVQPRRLHALSNGQRSAIDRLLLGGSENGGNQDCKKNRTYPSALSHVLPPPRTKEMIGGLKTGHPVRLTNNPTYLPLS